MLTKPMDVLTQFPIRKTGKQKAAFRDAAQAYAEGLGYPVTVEKGSMGARNIVIGDPISAKYLVTAHYDTPARMFLPNFITPCNMPVYLAYQFLVVGIIVLITFLCCIIAALLIDSFMVTTVTAYAVYFGALVLMMVGPANKNNSNDNTSGVVTVLEIAKSMPENQRNKVCFVLFDLEEAGLIGSAAFRKAHKKTTGNQIVLNLDCVGDGTDIVMFPSKKLKKDTVQMDALRKVNGVFGEKNLKLHEKGFAFCPSDQKNFPQSVGIMAFHRKKFLGIYCSRIHTHRDTVLEMTNVNILRAAIISLIGSEV